MELTSSDFERLLGWLDPDRERAGEKYERLRRKLIRFFEWRACPQAESLADETFDRVARRAADGTVIQGAAPDPYFYGVALRVAHECREHPHSVALPGNGPPQPSRPEPAETQRRLACLERCLQTLPPRNRELIERYYVGEKGAKIRNREKLAETLGISMSTLRLQALRIREKLQPCVRRCLEQGVRLKRIPASDQHSYG